MKKPDLLNVTCGRNTINSYLKRRFVDIPNEISFRYINIMHFCINLYYFEQEYMFKTVAIIRYNTTPVRKLFAVIVQQKRMKILATATQIV